MAIDKRLICGIITLADGPVKNVGGERKVYIAIVEDCAEDAAALKECIDKYAQKYNEVCSVKVYTDGEQFLSDYKYDVDVVFMDIEMPYRDGLKVSAALRETDPNVCLVFITNMRQYAIKGYEVSASDFIVKPLTYEVFEFHFRRIVEKIRHNTKAFICIGGRGNVHRVSVNDIDYVEVVDHKVLFHLGDKAVESWSPLYKIAEELERYGFAMCNSCYLVNLRHVRGVDDSAVYIADTQLKISRPKRKEFMEKLMLSMKNEG